MMFRTFFAIFSFFCLIVFNLYVLSKAPEEIEKRVRSKVVEVFNANEVKNISYDLDGRDLTLVGNVVNKKEKKTAGMLYRDIIGVRKVSNNIIFQRTKKSKKIKAKSSNATKETKKIIKEKEIPKFDHQYTTIFAYQDDVLSIEGLIPSEEEKQNLILFSKELGFKSVKERTLISDKNPNNWFLATKYSLRLLKNLQSGSLSIVGENVSLEGKSIDEKSSWSKIKDKKKLPSNFNIKENVKFKKVVKKISKKEKSYNCKNLSKDLNKLNIQYKTGSALLKKDSIDVLRSMIGPLKQCSKLKVWVVGHTDNSGDQKTNKELSLVRSRTAIYYLVDGGINKKRFEAIGAGSERPIASNKTQAGKAKNRRIEFVVRELNEGRK